MGIFSQNKRHSDDAILDTVKIANFAYPTSSSTRASYSELEENGWRELTSEQLGYSGDIDQYGAFTGERLPYHGAEARVLGRYDDNHNLTNIAISFRGTDSTDEVGLLDVASDYIADASAVLPFGIWQNYVPRAFNDLLTDVADYAQHQGLDGSDILITGHSLGGLAVNSMAASSAAEWDGFYQDANYVAFASPTINDKVFNIGFENDPVYQVLPDNRVSLPYSLTPTTLFARDYNPQNSTNNIVNFDSYYAHDLGLNPLHDSILNHPSWDQHSINEYIQGTTTILSSQFYPLTHMNSTIVVSTLPEDEAADIWVRDRNMAHEAREGTTFLLGTNYDDLIRGNHDNAYMEGFGGNDTFQPGDGYTVIAGGEGANSIYIDGSLNDLQTVYHDDVLYMKMDSGGIVQATDINSVTNHLSKGPFGLHHEDIDYQIGEDGLVAQNDQYADIAYAPFAYTAADGAPFRLEGDELWGFGDASDNIIASNTLGNSVIIGGGGDDTLISLGDDNTFLFSGDECGNSTIYNFSDDDTLVFSGFADTDNASITLDHSGLTLASGDGASVELMGVGVSDISADQVVIV